MQTEIIDCHIHPPLEDGHSALWFPEAGPIDSVAEFVDHLKRAGVTRCCGACIGRNGAEGFAPTAQMNRSALAFREEAGEFYAPAVQLDLRYPDESCRELEHYFSNEGVRWVGELVPYYYYASEELYTSDEAFEIFKLAQKLGVPVNFHCNRLEHIPSMCRSLPDLNFVLAHPKSDKQEFLARLDLVSKFANLYLDLSGSGPQRFGLVSKAIAEAGAEKLLFGSDFPICGAAGFIADIQAEGLPAEQLELIFSGNFNRLTGIA